MPIVDAKRVEALSPLIHCLGAEVLDQEDTGEEVTVPRAFLKAMEAKVSPGLYPYPVSGPATLPLML